MSLKWSFIIVHQQCNSVKRPQWKYIKDIILEAF